jgi:hypothetical protein
MYPAIHYDAAAGRFLLLSECGVGLRAEGDFEFPGRLRRADPAAVRRAADQ